MAFVDLKVARKLKINWAIWVVHIHLQYGLKILFLSTALLRSFLLIVQWVEIQPVQLIIQRPTEALINKKQDKYWKMRNSGRRTRQTLVSDLCRRWIFRPWFWRANNHYTRAMIFLSLRDVNGYCDVFSAENHFQVVSFGGLSVIHGRHTGSVSINFLPTPDHWKHIYPAAFSERCNSLRQKTAKDEFHKHG